jgi:hypothetical protein
MKQQHLTPWWVNLYTRQVVAATVNSLYKNIKGSILIFAYSNTDAIFTALEREQYYTEIQDMWNENREF